MGSTPPERQSTIVADNGTPEVYASKDFGKPYGDTYNHWLGFWHETRYFIDCIKAGTQPSCNFADAAASRPLGASELVLATHGDAEVRPDGEVRVPARAGALVR